MDSGVAVSHNVLGCTVDAIDFSQTVVAVLIVRGPSWEFIVGGFVLRREVLVDALAESKVGICHVGAVIVVEGAGTDVLVGQALEVMSLACHRTA